MPTGRKGRSGGRGPLIAVVAVVSVILVVAVGAGLVWMAVGSGDVELSVAGGDDEMEIAWTKESREERLGGGSEPVATYATWLTGDFVIRASTDGVAAYRVADGTPAWTVPVPDGARMCTAATTASGDRGVIAYGGGRCDRLGVIDLKAGKLARTMKVPMPKNAGQQPEVTRLVVAGDVAVVDDEGAMTAFGISDGRQRWRQADGDCRGDVWAMGDKRLVSDRRCISKRGTFLVTYDPATGKELTETFLGDRTVVLNVVSHDPVVAVTGTGAPIPTVVALDAAGEKTAEIPAEAAGRDLQVLGTTSLTSSAAIDQPSMVVHGDTLYAVNKAADPWAMVAFDLTTGKQRWTEKGNQGETKIIRVDDRGVWALQTGGGAGYLVVTDHKTGETSVVKEGALTPAWSSTKSSQVFERQGTLVVTPTSREIDVVPSLTVLR
ncbi:PQQ-binding-like beta-propeller repeat protein [Nonomuraea sp. CA-218870]|uniref:outer membrane protein assembly factor BamB family protein n=1 Tax=Nonomuraea sp. CA-218870 TaxID=3239998 RepID=UPI003D9258EC